jgi:hypothetical protein
MSFDGVITRENLNDCLKELAKEFRRLNGTKTQAELIMIGGASVLVNYGFRASTNDVDAVIYASSAMKEAVNRVGDRLGLPNGWLNADFNRTSSYSGKLAEISVYYKTFSSVLTVRTVSAEYLTAMKLMSGRRYKNDLSDIVGILREHHNNGNPISRASIDNAVSTLYGANAKLPAYSLRFIDNVFASNDLEKLYRDIRLEETNAKGALLQYEKHNPGKLTGENIDTIIEAAKRKRERHPAEKSGFLGMNGRLAAARAEAERLNGERNDGNKTKGEPER